MTNLPAYPQTSDLAKAIRIDYFVAKAKYKEKNLKFDSSAMLKRIADKYLIHRPDLTTPEELIVIVKRVWQSNKKKKA